MLMVLGVSQLYSYAGRRNRHLQIVSPPQSLSNCPWMNHGIAVTFFRFCESHATIEYGTRGFNAKVLWCNYLPLRMKQSLTGSILFSYKGWLFSTVAI